MATELSTSYSNMIASVKVKQVRAIDLNVYDLKDAQGNPGSDGDIENIERRNAVMSAVMKLPEKYRTVIHLFYFEDMSVTQISRATGIREATVKSQLSRARDMLEPMLKEVDF